MVQGGQVQTPEPSVLANSHLYNFPATRMTCDSMTGHQGALFSSPGSTLTLTFYIRALGEGGLTIVLLLCFSAANVTGPTVTTLSTGGNANASPVQIQQLSTWAESRQGGGKCWMPAGG